MLSAALNTPVPCVEAGEDIRLRLAPCNLSFIRVDHQTRLQFEHTEVVIESPFVLEGAIIHLIPGNVSNSDRFWPCTQTP